MHVKWKLTQMMFVLHHIFLCKLTKLLMFHSKRLQWCLSTFFPKIELWTLYWELIPLQSANATSIIIVVAESFTWQQSAQDKHYVIYVDGASSMLWMQNAMAQQLKQHCPLLFELHYAPHTEALHIKDAYNWNKVMRMVNLQLYLLILLLWTSKNMASLC